MKEAKDKPLKVIAGAPDRPLIIGKIKIPCYVLEDETRVLSRIGMLKAIGRLGKAKGGRQHDREFKIPVFLTATNLNPFISSELLRNSYPIVFSLGGHQMIGYKAEILPQVCEVYLKVRDAGVLLLSQRHIADRADVLIRGLATVGIIALVDEATGYQDLCDRRTLQKILDKYLLAERAKWAKRFPDDFYKEIFRLRGWEWQGMRVNRPQVVARYTNDIVWDRLAPGVREQLEKLNPKTPQGTRRARHHQWLTYDIGHPALQKHLNGVLVLMKSVIQAKNGWEEFKRRLQRVFPKLHTNLDLPFYEDE